MKEFDGFTHGMGIGGWLTNYKRFNVLTVDRRMQLTIGDYEHFQSYITESDIENISNMGMDHIRLGFDQLVIEEDDGNYRQSILEIIKVFVDNCIKYNLNVVLNLHKAIGNYCDIPEKVSLFDSEKLQNRFVKLWTMLENYFSDYKNIAFELLNEVRNIDPSLWNNLAERTVKAIRELNPSRKIIIGSIRWNSPNYLCKLKLYDDPNIIYTFHTYSPQEFTHQQGVLMADPLFYNRALEYPCDDIEKYRAYYKVVYDTDDAYSKYDRIDINVIRDNLKPAIDFINENPDKIVWCGEFGTIRHCNITYRENWMKDVITILKENNIPYCVWNYLSTPNDGNRFSLVDDDTRAILSERMLDIIRGNI